MYYKRKVDDLLLTFPRLSAWHTPAHHWRGRRAAVSAWLNCRSSPQWGPAWLSSAANQAVNTTDKYLNTMNDPYLQQYYHCVGRQCITHVCACVPDVSWRLVHWQYCHYVLHNKCSLSKTVINYVSQKSEVWGCCCTGWQSAMQAFTICENMVYLVTFLDLTSFSWVVYSAWESNLENARLAC